MLSRTSKQEILRKLEAKVGFPIEEGRLSEGTRQAVANLAEVQRRLLIISEILRGERRRVEGNAILSLASKMHSNHETEIHSDEVAKLQELINKKIVEIAAQIQAEDKASRTGAAVPEHHSGISTIDLRCPNCGANLPMPSGRFVKCSYCDTTLSIIDMSPQIRSMIQNI